jgi:NAD(P)-dependent dehydrogenase (short-subunit alcohol dehydrogenase family)
MTPFSDLFSLSGKVAPVTGGATGIGIGIGIGYMITSGMLRSGAKVYIWCSRARAEHGRIGRIRRPSTTFETCF